MNREIKFRAWDVSRKEMVDWVGITDHGSTMYKVMCNPQDDYVVMQFTGLKDSNGKDIYEGDITRSLVVDNSILAEVKFGDCYEDLKSDGYYGWYQKFINHVGGCQLNDTVVYTSEVIGNIYENPELLK